MAKATGKNRKKKSGKKTSKRKKKVTKTPAKKRRAKLENTMQCDALAVIDAAAGGLEKPPKKQAVKVRSPRRSKAAVEAARKPGRPPGPAPDRDVVVVTPSRCKKCGSTRRGAYTTKRPLPYLGKGPNGEDCSQVIRRPTVCLACGQHRIDKEFV